MLCFLCSKVPLRKRQKPENKRSEQCNQNVQSCISSKAVPTRCTTYSWRASKTNGPFKRSGGGAVPPCRIGVRVALGAQQVSVLWMILRETLGLALVGIAIGIPSALAVNKLISSMLFGLSSSDLPTIVMASLTLFAVALFAGYLPARKASSIDPMLALRTE